MKPLCLIASYGGSGSTFLTSALQSVAASRYDFAHVHGAPTSEFLGIPVFNRLTLGSEGPFSKDRELPRDSKVILIYRDPAEAYLSRCSFKHFLHIWSETDYLAEVFGCMEVSERIFNKLWQKHKLEDRDILDLNQFIDLWRAYAGNNRHDICFVRYERLAEAWSELLDFLKIEETGPSVMEGFAPRPRKVPEETAIIFASLRAKINAWPPIEVFPMEDGSAQAISHPIQVFPITLRDTVFTIEAPKAGANDSIERISVIADIVKTHFGSDVRLMNYQNYHSREVDFLGLFGLRDMVVTAQPDLPQWNQVKITTRELIFHLLYDRSFFRDGMEYLIQPVMSSGSWEVQRLSRSCGLVRAFLGKLRYTPQSIMFPDDVSAVKVVAHLRRQDICGGILFEGPEADEFPEKMRRGVQTRSKPLKSASQQVQEST